VLCLPPTSASSSSNLAGNPKRTEASPVEQWETSQILTTLSMCYLVSCARILPLTHKYHIFWGMHEYHIYLLQPQIVSPSRLVQDATAIAAQYQDNSPSGISSGVVSGGDNPTPLWVKNALPRSDESTSPSSGGASPPAVEEAEPSPQPRGKAAAKKGKGRGKGRGLGAKAPTPKKASGKKPRTNRVRTDAAYQEESLAAAAGMGVEVVRRATRSSRA